MSAVLRSGMLEGWTQRGGAWDTQTRASAQAGQDSSDDDSDDSDVPYTCDGCGAGLDAERYKCAVCHDFDFCRTCFSSGISVAEHDPTHPMVLVGGATPDASGATATTTLGPDEQLDIMSA